MSKRNSKSPEGDLVHGRVVNVVGAVEADDGAESCPGAEGPGAQGRDERGGSAGVVLLGAGEREVGLDAVAEGDDRDLLGGGVRLVVGCAVVWESRGGAYEEEPLGQEAFEGREVGCEGVHFCLWIGTVCLAIQWLSLSTNVYILSFTGVQWPCLDAPPRLGEIQVKLEHRWPFV